MSKGSTLDNVHVNDVIDKSFRHAGSIYVVKNIIHNKHGYYTLCVIRRGYANKPIWIDVLVDNGKIIYVDL